MGLVSTLERRASGALRSIDRVQYACTCARTRARTFWPQTAAARQARRRRASEAAAGARRRAMAGGWWLVGCAGVARLDWPAAVLVGTCVRCMCVRRSDEPGLVMGSWTGRPYLKRGGRRNKASKNRAKDAELACSATALPAANEMRWTDRTQGAFGPPAQAGSPTASRRPCSIDCHGLRVKGQDTARGSKNKQLTPR